MVCSSPNVAIFISIGDWFHIPSTVGRFSEHLVFFLFYRLQLVTASILGIPMEQSMGYVSKAYASHMEMGGYVVAVAYFFGLAGGIYLKYYGLFSAALDLILISLSLNHGFYLV